MRTLTTILACFAPLVISCGDKDDDTGATAVDADLERAEQLWEDVQGYSAWGQEDEWHGVTFSEDGTHGEYVQIWLNDDAFATVEAGAGGDMPDGAIIFKEAYDSEDESSLNSYTVMQKDSTYGTSGWFWAKYDTDGTVSGSTYGDVSGCSGCHSSGQDYVRVITW